MRAYDTETIKKWRKLFVYHISNKVLVARRNRNLKNSVIKVSCICHSADVYLKNWPLPKDNTEIVEVFHIFKNFN